MRAPKPARAIKKFLDLYHAPERGPQRSLRLRDPARTNLPQEFSNGFHLPA
ncbi:hypothetical protein X961_5849 [Burkholderia pseudomallei MSHR5613]|nr:hypothetical protein X961_5849 [Burkholderia pseudomallei MSHR5613]